jgi:hypothetical protein
MINQIPQMNVTRYDPKGSKVEITFSILPYGHFQIREVIGSRAEQPIGNVPPEEFTIPTTTYVSKRFSKQTPIEYSAK